jgi:4-hydroxybenzoate polyprenyltransferase
VVWLDALAYSSLWVSLAAGALCLAAADTMTGAPLWLPGALAFTGTLVVYNLDRVRDLEKDRHTAPLRSAFVERNRTRLVALIVLAGVASVGLTTLLGTGVIAALLPVLVLGLLHRRLKHYAYVKTLYIALAWVAVAVFLPAVVAERVAGLPWVAAIVGLTMLANVTACNIRDGEAASAALGEEVPLRLARVCAAVGIVVALLAPDFLRAMVLIPIATLIALAPFDPDERYSHVVVDGALLAGPLGTLAML